MNDKDETLNLILENHKEIIAAIDENIINYYSIIYNGCSIDDYKKYKIAYDAHTAAKKILIHLLNN